MGLDVSVVVARGLRVGDQLGDDVLESIRHDEGVAHAHASALNFLSYRPRSSREVRDYLRRKQVGEDVVEAVMQRLTAQGLVDDAEFARYWVENRQTFRPKGSRALRAELAGKGIDRSTVDSSLEALPDEEETAYAVGSKKARSYRTADDPEFFRKMTQFLQRRGFPYDVAASATRRIVADLHAN